MRFLLSLIILFLAYSKALSCDLSAPDKLKHIEYSKKATQILVKATNIGLFPIKPVKWIFNKPIQLIFPDNYVPEIVAASLVFSAGLLKEVPYDVLTPHDASFCDLVADCYGIKEGIENK